MSFALQMGLFLLGVICLSVGAHFLVKGSANIARILGVKPIIVGLTIVAFGTSMPEFMVSMLGALKGVSDISVGNIIGSNVANIGLILGVTGLIAPLSIRYGTVRQQLIILFFGSLIFALTAYNGISRLEGIIYVLMILIYVIYLTRLDRNETPEDMPETDNSILRNILYSIGGIAGLLFGSRWIISGATFIAVKFGISEMVIGMSIVAIGTSLPELAASIMAQIKHESDISIGNIIGSNLFNMFFVGGGTSIVKPLSINTGIYNFEVPVMILFTLMLFPMIFIKKGITKGFAAIYLAAYVGFIAISYFLM